MKNIGSPRNKNSRESRLANIEDHLYISYTTAQIKCLLVIKQLYN